MARLDHDGSGKRLDRIRSIIMRRNADNNDGGVGSINRRAPRACGRVLRPLHSRRALRTPRAQTRVSAMPQPPSAASVRSTMCACSARGRGRCLR